MKPGFSKIRIQPRIDSRIGSFSGRYKDIAVAYDGQTLHISTPEDSQIIMPDGSVHNVTAGMYLFECKEGKGVCDEQTGI